MGGAALSQLWLFWIAPLVGAIVAGVFYRWLGAPDLEPAPTAATDKPAKKKIKRPVE